MRWGYYATIVGRLKSSPDIQIAQSPKQAQSGRSILEVYMRLLSYVTTVSCALALASLGAATVAAQQDHLDSVKADAAHHRVEFENDQVSVVRYKIAPGETPRTTAT